MSWLVVYRKKNGRKEYMIELDSVQKLMAWIGRNAAGCSMVLIQRVEGSVS